jgi:hypothetical protein
LIDVRDIADEAFGCLVAITRAPESCRNKSDDDSAASFRQGGRVVGIVRIVVGFDGSDPIVHALCFAIGLARRERARVSACFVALSPIVIYAAGLVSIETRAMRRP